ncbi:MULTISPECIES: nickel ABC transporter permease [Bacillaceae]|uniref:Nickel import system permease protein NikB n=1 Tax=Domibacillus aminovorans TaxID=29332 RepID=A0A177KXA2_9BACI|nr:MULTISPECIES: nickel ABC transporter permease [Bacillaceae]OAH57960.1 nickel ABC transporter permease subunit NikB [Domibacillus aminovorans]
MFGFIIKRLASMIPILVGVSFITFILIHLVPVEPAEAYLRLSNGVPTEEAIQEVRGELGLDKPLYAQYVDWLYKAVQLDFGTSFVTKQPVWDEMMIYIPATVQLTVTAFILMLILSLPIGVFSALYKDKLFDQISRMFSYVGASMPGFWLGFLLIYFFSLQLNLLPTSGKGTLFHLVLPSLTLALAHISTYARLLRTSMLENFNQPFVFYARARGLRERTVIVKHVLKNALLPVITVAGMGFGYMLAGSVIVENVFAWPGIGRFFVSAVFNRDYPVIQCYVLFNTAIFVLVNMIVDIACAALDPRIR